MGKRSAEMESFLRKHGLHSMGGYGPSYKGRGNPVMTTKLERIAAKAKKESTLQFTSLTHHVTKELIWKSLHHMPEDTAPGIDGVTATEAQRNFPLWADKMMRDIHQKGYKPPAVRRVWIPKPGKAEKRPIGVPAVADRALQRSTAHVLSAIYEQDFLDCSFGGRPGRGAHHALATLNEIISGKKVGWVLEADLKNYFGSLDHEWMMKFVRHRIGDPRILSLIQRWLKAGVMENEEIVRSKQGTPQGGSISVLLSNIYLHYVLDLWFEKSVKSKLKGEAYLIRYIDDFIVCFQYRADAKRFHDALQRRLGKFELRLEPDKTGLVEFGRFAKKHAKEWGKKLNTIYFLGFTHYCTQNKKGNFMVGRKTEKSRLKRSITKMQETLRYIRHWPIQDQVIKINQKLQGHYNYYGVAGNLESLCRLYNETEKYWRKMLSSRSRKGYVNWEKFQHIKSLFPLVRPKLSIPYGKLKGYVRL
ncbi:group II intron reverse transcriptase/maturase [Lentibacillus salicampi]|uniref:Group II intron reverse transcriptase/maturase n=2 Tax=Lentibacillus salicampi TaxID=175306 RepID=A0A4Y9A669_9BACI|nr:group II intron reverse transcriptase/maturase [Lentibacillus salicampi]